MLNYTKEQDGLKDWIVEDTQFDTRYFGKTESIMALGNGYMGMRSAHEEDYLGQKRNFFVSGTFNISSQGEVTELPNLPDVIRMGFFINGRRLSLERGTLSAYSKQINLYTGELTRQFTWTSPEEKTLHFQFRRFISSENRHLMGTRVEIRFESETELEVHSGINGQVTNSGAMHLSDGVRRIYDGEVMTYKTSTLESGIDIALATGHAFKQNGQRITPKLKMDMDRRQVSLSLKETYSKGDVLVIEKLAAVHTSRDKGRKTNEDQLDKVSLETVKSALFRGYEELQNESAAVWKTYWDKVDIQIVSDCAFDQLAIRFAQYHLKVMTPVHDERMGIGAKGLTGEGYKGHSFWDTEIFLLPFYYFSLPQVARTLLKYRYHGLAGAKRKAKDNGYSGAMYPWEAAWIDDGEVTPKWGEVDVVTGQPIKVLSGLIEQHITSDIVYAIWSYFRLTNDTVFMDDYGYEIIFETAIFWSSRLEWDTTKKAFVINDVIGPDEYKEHVDNNAYTNYMAKLNTDLALAYYDQLKAERPELAEGLNKKTGFGDLRDDIESRMNKLYLPVPQEGGILPQDDTYLYKEQIDLSKYKTQEHVGSIFKDYNMDQVSDIQVSKQADMMMLFYLRENLFDKTVRKANWDYYEPKTLHDSSLSLSIHSVIASDIHDYKRAYDLFRQATEIDLGMNMRSSDQGIHAASLGGIWQCIVNGFAGVRLLEDRLRISPNLPEAWTSVKVPLVLEGADVILTVCHDYMTLDIEESRSITVEIKGEIQIIEGHVKIDLVQDRKEEVEVNHV